MQESGVTQLPAAPDFDLEEFMNFAQEKRIPAETLELLGNYWNDWLQKLQARQLRNRQGSWLVVCLPQEVEDAIDHTWEESPSDGYLLNNLAQYFIMRTVGSLVPQTADFGCAPLPARSEALDAVLAESGLATQAGASSLRYFVLTYYPFKGGCEVCSLRKGCPKLAGPSAFTGVTLPGHEPGRDA